MKLSYDEILDIPSLVLNSPVLTFLFGCLVFSRTRKFRLAVYLHVLKQREKIINTLKL